MSDTKPPTPPEAKAMTAAEAAKRVKRTVVERVPDGKDDAGKPIVKEVTKRVAVKAEEVLSFRDYGTHVVVVTTDGQKLASTPATADEA